MRRIGLALTLATCTLLPTLANAQPGCPKRPFTQTGDDPSNPTFTAPVGEFGAWISDMGVDLDCNDDINEQNCYENKPGSLDQGDFNGWLRRLLNSFALLDTYPFNSSSSWTDIMRTESAGFRIIEPELDCKDSPAETVSAEHRTTVRSNFHQDYPVPFRAAVLAHELRHGHGGGYFHSSDCPNGDNCDSSWGYFGPHRFFVHLSRQFADDFTNWPKSARAKQLERANDYLNGFFDVYPGFNLALDELTSIEVPFQWDAGGADSTCEVNEKNDLPVEHERYALRNVSIQYGSIDMGQDGQVLKLAGLQCHFNDPGTGAATTGFVIPGDSVPIASPSLADYMVGLFVAFNTEPIPVNPQRLRATGAFWKLQPSGVFTDFKTVSNDETISSQNADAWAVAKPLHVIKRLHVSTSPVTGTFDDMIIESRLPWPYTSYAGGTGGAPFPVTNSADGSCPDTHIGRKLLVAQTPNGKFVSFMGLICEPLLDYVNGIPTGPEDLVMVHTGLDGAFDPGVAFSSEVFSIITTVAANTTGLDGVDCPDFSAMTSVMLDAGQYVERLRAISCRSHLTETPITVWHNQESSSGETFQLSCDQGRGIDGFYLRDGSFLDGIAMRCGKPW